MCIFSICCQISGNTQYSFLNSGSRSQLLNGFAVWLSNTHIVCKRNTLYFRLGLYLSTPHESDEYGSLEVAPWLSSTCLHSHFVYFVTSYLGWQEISSWRLNSKESTWQCWRCGFNPWSRKDPLEKETTATLGLAWRISWTERSPGRLLSRGCKESGARPATEQQQSRGDRATHIPKPKWSLEKIWLLLYSLPNQ